MDRIAQAPPAERAELFRRSAAALRPERSPAPPEERIPALRADYARMREMIFGEAPAWEQIVQGLQELEDQINGG